MQAAAASLISEDAYSSRGQAPTEDIIEEERALDSAATPTRYTDEREQQHKRFPPSHQPTTTTTEAFSRSGDETRPASGLLSLQGPYEGFELSTRRSPLDLNYKPTDSRFEKREKRRAFWRRQAVNAVLICSWYLFSSLISLYNKWFFSPDHYGFSYPLFVTTFHMIVQFCLSGVVLSFVPRFRPKVAPTPQDYLKKASPCGVATSLDIGLSNVSLKTVTLSFYTMCKSSSLGFVLLFAFLFHLERPTWKLCGIITIITVGVILMVSGETKFSLEGMITVLSASAMGGLRWALTQKLLDKEAMGLNNPFATLFWLAPIMAVTLALCSLLVEGPIAVFSQDKFWEGFSNTMRTAFLICFPGGLAFAMTTSEFALIQRTSVVTLSVAGIFKEVSTILLGTVVFHDELTPINVSGLVVTIFGIALYNVLKYRQSMSPEEAAAAQQNLRDHHHGSGDQRGVYAQPGQQTSMQNLPLYNPANEGLEATLNDDDEAHYALGSDSDSDRDDKAEAEAEADERRGFHREHQPVYDAAEGKDVQKALKSDAHLLEIEEEGKRLEESMLR